MRHSYQPVSLLPALVLLACLAAGPGRAETKSTPAAGGPADAARQAGRSPGGVELQPREVTYRARVRRGISIRGRAVRALRPLGDGRWAYRFDVDSFIADIRESTVFDFDGRRVQPLEYRYSLDGFIIRDRVTRYDFDWDNLATTDLENDRVIDFSHVPALQDQLGAQLQLWVDLRAGKTSMGYTVLDDGDFERYRFAVLGEETLETENFGEVETVRVKRVRKADSPRTTHMWFAPGWDHILVRLEQTNTEGEDFEIYLEKAQLHDRIIEP